MRRRDFIKTGVGAVAAAGVMSARALAAEEPAKKKDRGFPPIAGGFDIPIPPQPVLRFGEGERIPSPDELVDILAIQRLQMTYGHLHEHGTADEIAALFHPEAELYALYLVGKGFRGRDQIRDWYAWWLPFYAEDGECYQHRPLNQVIDLHGDRAVSNSVLVAEGAPRANDQWTSCVGRYVHELIRHEGGWLFWRSWITLHSGTALSPRKSHPRFLWNTPE